VIDVTVYIMYNALYMSIVQMRLSDDRA